MGTWWGGKKKKNWRRESHRRHHPLFLRVVVHFPRSCYISDFAISNMCITVFAFFFLLWFSFKISLSSVSLFFLLCHSCISWLQPGDAGRCCKWMLATPRALVPSTLQKHGAVYLVPLCAARMSHPRGLRGKNWSVSAYTGSLQNMYSVAM